MNGWFLKEVQRTMNRDLHAPRGLRGFVYKFQYTSIMTPKEHLK